MSRNSHWFNRVRLSVETLESRTQPGSLLTSGIDLGAVADVIAPPETSQGRRIKKLQDDSEDIQIVGTSRDDHTAILAARVSAAKGTEAKAATTDRSLNSHIPSRSNIVPAIPPSIRNDARNGSSVQQAWQNRWNTMNVVPIVKYTDHRPSFDPCGLVQYEPIDLEITPAPCGGFEPDKGLPAERILDGSISHLTYTDNGGTTSRAFGNAGGRGGANIGTQYVVGTIDGDGLVMRIPSAGACTAVRFDAGADPVQFNDADATASGVVAVGTVDTAAGDIGVLVRMDPTSMAVTSGPWGYSGAGLDIRLNGVGFRAVLSPSTVIMTGECHNQTSETSSVFAALWDSVLGSQLAQKNWTYLDLLTGTVPVNCVGNAVVGDRLANAHFAIACDETQSPTGAITNVTARLQNDFSTLLWDAVVWDGVAFTSLPGQGNLGERLQAGTAPESGLRTVGGFELSVVNPGFVSALNVKWTDLANPAGPTITGGIWYMAPGFDFFATDVAMQRPDSGGGLPMREFTAGKFGVPGGDYMAVLDEYDDGFAAYVAGYGFDATDTEEAGYGVDVVTGAPFTGIYFAGTTDGDLGTMINCDTTYNGGLDGFGATFTQIPG